MGRWRSWLARMHDTHEVTGSNPVRPIQSSFHDQGHGVPVVQSGQCPPDQCPPDQCLSDQLSPGSPLAIADGLTLTARRSLAWAAIVLVLAGVIGRLMAPSDLWDQAQPRTVAYTADILVHGGASWLLPIDADGLGATKPPLYNWLAVPFVAFFGRANEIAHRLPSLLALLATLSLVIVVGERVARGVGWLAALMLVASYPMLKLGTIARPDMVLVLLLLVGFLAGTRLLGRGIIADPGQLTRRDRWHLAWQAVFWCSVVAAAWTKGPAALLPPLYVLAAGRVIGGRFAASNAVGWWWGIPALAAIAAWPLAVWFIDADHLVHRLWDQEFMGRVAGSGSEGGGRGWRGILTGLPAMPAYFMLRFGPWSLVTIAAIAAINRIGWTRRGDRERCDDAGIGTESGARRWSVRVTSSELLLRGAVVWIALVLLLFSLSSGKRADYIAPAYPVAALIAAWWLVGAIATREVRERRRAMVATIAVGGVVVTTVIVVAWVSSPLDRGGPQALLEIDRRVRAERRELLDARLPTPIVAIGVPAEHLPATLATGRPCDSNLAAVIALIDSGGPALVLYDRTNLDGEIAARLHSVESGDRLARRWSVDVPWKSRDGLPLRNVSCVAVLTAPKFDGVHVPMPVLSPP